MAGKAVARQSKPKPPAKTVEGKVVGSGSRQQQQSSINVTYNINGEGGSTPGSGQNPVQRGNNWIQRQMAKEPRQVPLPNGIPRAFGNAKIVGYAWVGAMILIAYDEWHNNQIMPRPSRFWYSSIVYAGLALMTFIPPIIPIINLLALGYTFMLLWQYFNGQGQFSGEAAPTTGEAEGGGGPL